MIFCWSATSPAGAWPTPCAAASNDSGAETTSARTRMRRSNRKNMMNRRLAGGKGIKKPVLDKDGHIMGQVTATIALLKRRPVERRWRNIGFASAPCSIVCRIARNGHHTHGRVLGPFAARERAQGKQGLEAGLAQ